MHHYEQHYDDNTFALVFFLLQDEHGVVEQLLQLLIGVVDAELFERVELEDLKAGHVQDADEGSTLTFGAVQRAVDAPHQPAEHALVTRFRNGFDGKFNLQIRHHHYHHCYDLITVGLNPTMATVQLNYCLEIN